MKDSCVLMATLNFGLFCFQECCFLRTVFVSSYTLSASPIFAVLFTCCIVLGFLLNLSILQCFFQRSDVLVSTEKDTENRLSSELLKLRNDIKIEENHLKELKAELKEAEKSKSDAEKELAGLDAKIKQSRQNVVNIERCDQTFF